MALIDRLEGRTLGDYHILEKIGQGGMTTVYKALDLSRHRMVALKVLSPYIGQDPSFSTRFQREIELLEKLRHPNIVPILDYGESDLYTYIVMPYYAEGTLQDRLRKSPLDPYEIARLTKQVSGALAFAHEKGIVHRDVKPSNILIDDEGKAMLGDFGFARVTDLSISLTGSAVIGTPAYMSPEQCKGGDIDVRSDQYSLGIVLYQLFTGRVPFEGETPMAVAVQHINEPLPRPGRLNPELPQPIENVLIQALAKEPNHRYSNIDKLNDSFQEAVRDSVDGFGRLVPPKNRFSLNTFIMERTPLGKPIEAVTGMWHQQRPFLVSILLLLLLLPTAAYAIASFQNGGQEEPRAGLTGGGDDRLQATIDALSTEISSDTGGGLDPSLIEAAVAGTMSANARVQSGRPTSTPGLFETLAASQRQGTPTEQVTILGLSPGATSTPSGSGGGGSGPAPTSIPSKTPAPTSGPTPTPAPSNTPQPAPTSTPVPAPTSTPVPAPSATPIPPTTNPNACQDDKPSNPNYCTPTP